MFEQKVHRAYFVNLRQIRPLLENYDQNKNNSHVLFDDPILHDEKMNRRKEQGGGIFFQTRGIFIFQSDIIVYKAQNKVI